LFAVSQLLEELFAWKPRSDREMKTLREVLQDTKRVEDTLNELGPKVETTFDAQWQKI